MYADDLIVLLLMVACLLFGWWLGHETSNPIAAQQQCLPTTEDAYGITYSNGECVIMRKDIARKMLAAGGKL